MDRHRLRLRDDGVETFLACATLLHDFGEGEGEGEGEGGEGGNGWAGSARAGTPRHCEARSGVAIHFQQTRPPQWIATGYAFAMTG